MSFVLNPLICGAFFGFLVIVYLRANALILRRISRIQKIKNAFEHIQYIGDNIHVIHTVVELLHQYLAVSSAHILIDAQDDFLETVYCSEENRSKHIRLKSSLFAPYIFESGTILMKENIENQFLLSIYDKCSSEIILVLHNKKRVFGLILLGPKKKNKKYSRYDRELLHDLYPYFYVFVYYLTNIAFQPLAGVVAKEIHFSREVIQSIQDNVDKIQYTGVDGAVCSSSANGLYGNYADIIHLHEDTYLVTVGDFGRMGLPICMTMVILKTMIRLFALQTDDLKKLIILIQDFIKNNLPADTRFSAVFMLFDFESGFMHYADCGISSLLIYNSIADTVTEIHRKGSPLSADNSAPATSVYRIALRQGTSILACTGEMHEREYIKKCLSIGSSDAQAVIRRLYDSYALTDQKLQNDSCAALIQILPRKHEGNAMNNKEQ